MKKSTLLPLCLLLLLCIAVPASAYLQPGSMAPDFELPGLDGKKVHLSDFKGQIILLQLGTTWCPDCVGQSADLMKMGPYLKEQGAVLVDVFIQESPRSVGNFLKDKSFAMQMVPLLDDGQAHQAYQVYLIPRLLIIDQQFRIVHDGLRLKAEAVKEKIAALQKTQKTAVADPSEKNHPCPPAQ